MTPRLTTLATTIGCTLAVTMLVGCSGRNSSTPVSPTTVSTSYQSWSAEYNKCLAVKLTLPSDKPEVTQAPDAYKNALDACRTELGPPPEATGNPETTGNPGPTGDPGPIGNPEPTTK
ncbi:MAG: hypothetical protein B5766_02660 [Candidatus Lumbricidophila eiseniae]|uniref:Uncharacterized protein n=1 Tax=Candidatus Lumbricidiphila eiseniae TaxID=1969409 RepID=A0A2A6FTX4_9MICO|nr:MAG: hypothetical protein B5766_02660 [Candidatus Lumbricidophila eiseniae]